MEIVSSLWKFYTGKIFIFERMRETIIRMIQVFLTILFLLLRQDFVHTKLL